MTPETCTLAAGAGDGQRTGVRTGVRTWVRTWVRAWVRAGLLLAGLLLVSLAACRGGPGPARRGATAIDPGSATRGGTGASEGEVSTAFGTWRVAWRSVPAPVPLNTPFAVEAWLRPAGGDGSWEGDTWDGGAAGDVQPSLVIDAGMPHHQHGMNRTPELSRLPDGGFRADGMLFHMPGAWTLVFDVSRGGITERAEVVLTVGE